MTMDTRTVRERAAATVRSTPTVATITPAVLIAGIVLVLAVAPAAVTATDSNIPKVLIYNN